MISPESIFWEATYRCPYCEFPNFVSMKQMSNSGFNKIFCGCGRSFKIDKPELKFAIQDKIFSEIKINSGFANEIKSILSSQGYTSPEIKTAIEISSSEGVDNIADLFTKIIPRI